MKWRPPSPAAGHAQPPAFTGPWYYLFWLMRRQRRRVLVGALLGCLWALSLIVAPYALQMAIDHGLQPRRAGALVGWVAVLVAVAGLTATLAVLRHRTMTRVRMDAAFRTVRLVGDHSMRLGHTVGCKGLGGEVAAIGLSDSWLIGRSLTATGPGVGAVLAYGAIAVLLLRVSPLLAMVILLGVPVLALVVGPVLSRLTKAQLPYREQQAALADQSLDIAGGLRVLNALGGKELFRGRFAHRSTLVRDAGYRVGGLVSVVEAMAIALPTLYIAAVVWLAARLAAAGTISVGELVAVYGYAAVLIIPVASFVEGATDFAQAMVPTRRVIRFLSVDSVDSVDQAPRMSPTPVPAGQAELLDTVTGVRVEPASFTAVVTPRQSDARGILDRLAGLEPGGTWGGRALDEVPPPQVRSRVLLADHDAALFSGSLVSNVAGRFVDTAGGGADDRPGAAVRRAIAVAAADDIVAGLDGGWAGALEAGGTNLSGGQRQRLRLARAIAADPEVLLAVDPTSALDALTEAVVAARLRAARSERTTVITTTSPPLLERATRVHLVIDNRVVASGTHHQLLRERRYHQLVVRGDAEAAS